MLVDTYRVSPEDSRALLASHLSQGVVEVLSDPQVTAVDDNAAGISTPSFRYFPAVGNWFVCSCYIFQGDGLHSALDDAAPGEKLH